MRHMKSAVTGTLQEKNGKFYLVLRIPDSTGKLHQKWVSTGLPVQGNQRRAKQLLDAKLVELQADYDQKQKNMEHELVDVVCDVVEKVFLVQFGDKKEIIEIIKEKESNL